MLLKMSDQIAHCYRHAVACAQRAKSEHDPSLQDDWLTMERRWITLARSYELSGFIERFQLNRPRLN